jgi:hypothetical protein
VLPENVERATFIFQVPNACPKQLAASSGDTRKTRMANDAADSGKIQAIRGECGVTYTRNTLVQLPKADVVESSRQ